MPWIVTLGVVLESGKAKARVNHLFALRAEAYLYSSVCRFTYISVLGVRAVPAQNIIIYIYIYQSSVCGRACPKSSIHALPFKVNGSLGLL